MEIEYNRFCRLFIFAAGIKPQKEQKVLITLLKPATEQLLHSLVLQKDFLGLITDFKTGFKIDEMEITTDHIQSKRVKSADMRFMYSVHLLRYSRNDLFTHLRCGSIGKSHHQHLVDGYTVVLNYLLDTLHKHCGFARARSSGNQDTLIPYFDGLPLFFCPVHRFSL